MRIVANASVSRRRWPAFAVVAVGVACAWPAQASIYKCEGSDGSPVYQDSPCPPGKVLRDFDKDPPTVSVMPLLPGPAPGTTSTQTLPPAPAKTKNGAKSKANPDPGTVAKAGGRKLIAPGINEGEVMARLGPPDMKSGGGSRKVARWTYLPAPDDPGTVTTLTFESGRLVEVERKVVK